MTTTWQKTWAEWDENDNFAWKKATGSWIYQQVTDYSWNINCLDIIGHRPLHYIAKHTQTDGEELKATIKTAVSLNAYINAIGYNNMLPIHSASRFNVNPNVIYTLRENGSSLDERTLYEGNTPLHLAVLYNPNPFVTDALIKKGAKLDIPNYEGLIPLDAISKNTPQADAKTRLLCKAMKKSVFVHWVRQRV